MTTPAPSPVRIVTVVGARPQFVKAAALSRAVARHPGITERIVHTGQHFDDNMSEVFFRELGIPRPTINLAIPGGPHGATTGRMLEAIERVLTEDRPDWLLVFGDTNSTLAGALAAAKLHVPVAHVEAGLRSFNRAMPEEINRVLTDHASDLLFTPTRPAAENLRTEGIPESRIVPCGDVMLDAMLHAAQQARTQSTILARHGLTEKAYILATVHRAENTDDPARLAGIVEGLTRLTAIHPVVLPLHPRTRAALDAAGLLARAADALRLIDPVGYIDMVRLESGAALIATDSGGVQKEACFNAVPCVTLRDQTEWTELIEAGVNTLAGADPDAIEAAARGMMGRPVDHAGLYGDGDAAGRIVAELIARTPLKGDRGSGSARAVQPSTAAPPASHAPAP